LVGFRVDDLDFEPGGGAVWLVEALSVALAAEFGHGVFIVDVIDRDIEMVGDFLVEFGFANGVAKSFVTAGFYDEGVFRKGEGWAAFYVR